MSIGAVAALRQGYFPPLAINGVTTGSGINDGINIGGAAASGTVSLHGLTGGSGDAVNEGLISVPGLPSFHFYCYGNTPMSLTTPYTAQPVTSFSIMHPGGYYTGGGMTGDLATALNIHGNSCWALQFNYSWAQSWGEGLWTSAGGSQSTPTTPIGKAVGQAQLAVIPASIVVWAHNNVACPAIGTLQTAVPAGSGGTITLQLNAGAVNQSTGNQGAAFPGNNSIIKVMSDPSGLPSPTQMFQVQTGGITQGNSQIQVKPVTLASGSPVVTTTSVNLPVNAIVRAYVPFYLVGGSNGAVAVTEMMSGPWGLRYIVERSLMYAGSGDFRVWRQSSGLTSDLSCTSTAFFPADFNGGDTANGYQPPAQGYSRQVQFGIDTGIGFGPLWKAHYGATNPTLATLTSALSNNSGPATTISASVTSTIPAGLIRVVSNVNNGITYAPLGNGDGTPGYAAANTQLFYTPGAASGANSITISSTTPAVSFPAGSIVQSFSTARGAYNVPMTNLSDATKLNSAEYGDLDWLRQIPGHPNGRGVDVRFVWGGNDGSILDQVCALGLGATNGKAGGMPGLMADSDPNGRPYPFVPHGSTTTGGTGPNMTWRQAQGAGHTVLNDNAGFTTVGNEAWVAALMELPAVYQTGWSALGTGASGTNIYAAIPGGTGYGTAGANPATACPASDQVTLVGPGPTLSTALSTSGNTTQLSVTSAAGYPAIANGTQITLTSGSNTQTFTTSQAYTAGSYGGGTPILVNSQQANFAYPIGTVLSFGIAAGLGVLQTLNVSTIGQPKLLNEFVFMGNHLMNVSANSQIGQTTLSVQDTATGYTTNAFYDPSGFAVGTPILLNRNSTMPLPGSLLIAIHITFATTAGLSQAPSGWTQQAGVQTGFVSGTTGSYMTMWTKVATGTEGPSDFHFTTSSSVNQSLWWQEVAGHMVNPTLDGTVQTGYQSTGSTSATVGSTSTLLSQTPEFVFQVIHGLNGYGASFTNSGQNWITDCSLAANNTSGPFLLIGHPAPSIVSSLTDVPQLTATWTSSSKYGWMIAAFKGSAPN